MSEVKLDPYKLFLSTPTIGGQKALDELLQNSEELQKQTTLYEFFEEIKYLSQFSLITERTVRQAFLHVTTKKTHGKCTLYVRNDYYGNVVKTLCKTIEWHRTFYAQYDHAFKVTYIPKGASKERYQYVYHFEKIWGLIADGYDTPEVPVFMNKESQTIEKVRHQPFSPIWIEEFEAIIEEFKKTKSFNILDDLGAYQDEGSAK